jgi:hypothetical protein
MRTMRKQAKAQPLSSEARSALQAQLGRLTNLHPDVATLDPEEQRALKALLQKAKGDGNGARPHPDPAALGKRDRSRLERLIEKASGKEGAFAAERERAEAQSQMSLLMARARRVRRPRFEEPGALILPAEFVSSIADGKINTTNEVLVLVYVLAQLESGQAFGMGCRIEGDALVIPPKGSLSPPGGDPEGRFGGKKAALEHLARNEWLAVSQGHGGTIIRRGPRWLAAVERRERS